MLTKIVMLLPSANATCPVMFQTTVCPGLVQCGITPGTVCTAQSEVAFGSSMLRVSGDNGGVTPCFQARREMFYPRVEPANLQRIMAFSSIKLSIIYKVHVERTSLVDSKPKP